MTRIAANTPTDDLVEALERWELRPSNEDLVRRYLAAIDVWAEAHGLRPLFVRSEIARLRRQRPQPTPAAALAAIANGDDL